GNALVEDLAILGEDSHATEAIDSLIGDAGEDDRHLIPHRPMLPLVIVPHLRWEDHFAGQFGVWEMMHHPGLALRIQTERRSFGRWVSPDDQRRQGASLFIGNVELVNRK